MEVIEINGRSIRRETLQEELARLGVLPTDASESDFAVGCFLSTASDVDVQILRDLGIELLTPPAEVQFAARFDGGDLRLIDALPFVDWVLVFPDEVMPAFGLTRGALENLRDEPDGSEDPSA